MAAIPPPSAAIAPASRPLGSFFFDLGVAVALVLGLSVAGIAVWAVVRSIAVAMRQTRPDAAAVAAAIGQPGALAQMLVALVSTGTAALLLYYWRRPASVAERMASRSAIGRASTWGWIALALLAALAFSQFVARLTGWLGIDTMPTNRSMVEGGMAGFPWLMAVFAVALAPLYEELLFRRVLFGRLWQAGRPWLGLLLSSAAFALLHELPGTHGWRESLPLWLVYGFLGAAFAGVYWRTGTLWAAIATHALNNGIALLALP